MSVSLHLFLLLSVSLSCLSVSVLQLQPGVLSQGPLSTKMMIDARMMVSGYMVKLRQEDCHMSDLGYTATAKSDRHRETCQ